MDQAGGSFVGGAEVDFGVERAAGIAYDPQRGSDGVGHSDHRVAPDPGAGSGAVPGTRRPGQFAGPQTRHQAGHFVPDGTEFVVVDGGPDRRVDQVTHRVGQRAEDGRETVHLA